MICWFLWLLILVGSCGTGLLLHCDSTFSFDLFPCAIHVVWIHVGDGSGVFLCWQNWFVIGMSATGLCEIVGSI